MDATGAGEDVTGAREARVDVTGAGVDVMPGRLEWMVLVLERLKWMLLVLERLKWMLLALERLEWMSLVLVLWSECYGCPYGCLAGSSGCYWCWSG
jgi:hypothetical protein